MMKRIHWKTIVISDTHLGTKDAKARELVRFLKANTCDKLILNGDIIDGWRLRKNGKWKKKHSRFFKIIIRMIQSFDTEVIYIRGNHDDFLDQIIPLQFGKLSVVRDHVLTSQGKKYWVIHGDVFDRITTHFRWLAHLGDAGYSFLLWMNKIYNNRRIKKGLPFYSLSKVIKHKVKSAVSYISDYEAELVKLAHKKGYDGIICGHIHSPANRWFQNVHYLNSGDWVESLTALVEDKNGNWQVVYYQELEKDPPE